LRQTEPVAATHAFLQIVCAFRVAVMNNRHHMLIVPPHELVTGGDE